MHGPLFLGIDVGTQSVKLIALDAEHGVVDTASHPLETLAGLPPGHSEQNPSDWLDAIRAVCRVSGARIDLGKTIALAVSGQQHGFVPIDANGHVIRPAKLWNDVSSHAECEAIVRELGGSEALFERTGNGLPPGFTAGKIRWLREHEPENFARLAHVLLPHDYVNFWLTGEPTCEVGDASGTGLFDVRNRRFDAEVADAVAPGLLETFPRMLDTGEPAGRVQPKIASELGIPAGTLVAPGGGDNMMAAIGAGAVEPGIVVMSLGTSGTVFARADRPICDPHGEIAAFCGSGDRGWLPLGCTMNATVSSELAREAFDWSLGELEAALDRAAPGAGGVLCLPFFTGERSPNLPNATGSLFGLTPNNFTRENIARAAVEGATFSLVRLLDRLRELGVEARELRLTGGGSNSPTWRRIVAAAADLPVTSGVHADAAALGAAVQALWVERRRGAPRLPITAVRRELELDDALTHESPPPDHVAVYRERRREFEASVDRMRHDDA